MSSCPPACLCTQDPGDPRDRQHLLAAPLKQPHSSNPSQCFSLLTAILSGSSFHLQRWLLWHRARGRSYIPFQIIPKASFNLLPLIQSLGHSSRFQLGLVCHEDLTWWCTAHNPVTESRGVGMAGGRAVGSQYGSRDCPPQCDMLGYSLPTLR